MRALAIGLASACLVIASEAAATTYRVGPGEQYEQLTPLMRDVLQPGDVIEVMGDAEYDGDLVMWGGNWPGAASGTAEAPITLRGIRVNGKRPVIRAGAEWGIVLYMNHTLFEGFEVEGGSLAAVIHKADHVVIRDVLVRDCLAHGILGTDQESGNLLMEFVEVARCGEGLYHHQVYVAGDEVMYPGHVFRMQHCYVHDGRGGNSVKSRAERNEIYFNWIEGAPYHELDLIGPTDPAIDLVAREDSDIVGNVLIKPANSDFGCYRFGGDGNLSSRGRYRIVNNTCVLGPSSAAAFFLQYELESVEMHNSVIVGGPAGARLGTTVDGADAPIEGTNNFFSPNLALSTSGNTPVSFTGSIVGDAAAAFEDLAGGDLRPRAGSLLIDAGADPVPTSAAHPFPNPLARPELSPPLRAIEALPRPRPVDGPLDVGALEFGTPLEPPTPSEGGGGAGAAGAGGSDADGDGDGDGVTEEGCGCRLVAPNTPRPAGWGALITLAALARARRRLHSKR